MTAAELLKDLKNRKYKPVYLLHGEEPYYIDEVSDFVEHKVLTDAEKGFNQTVFYGKDTDVMTVLNASKRYPMMADYQVVLVKEAQDMKWGNEKTYKAIEKNGVIVESTPLYDNKVPGWIEDFVAEKGYKISQQATFMLAEYLGNDLSKIANELEKLMLNVAQGQEISLKLVQDNIGISREYNVFELQTALSKKDVLKANQIINYFEANPRSNPIVLVLGNLNNFFSKVLLYHYDKDKSPQNLARELGVSPYFLKDYELAARSYNYGKSMQIISLLREYDLKSKGVDSNSGNGELMKELMFKILH